MVTTTFSHLQAAKQYLREAENLRAEHGDGDPASLATIAQAHATLALVETIQNIQEERRILRMHT